MVWLPPPTGKRSLQPEYRVHGIQISLTLNFLFGIALRQTTGQVGSLLKRIALERGGPDISTGGRRQKTLAVKIPLRVSHGYQARYDCSGLTTSSPSSRAFIASAAACAPAAVVK